MAKKEIELADDIFLSDEKIQSTLNAREIVDYFQTDVHSGRHISAKLTANGDLYFKQSSYHVVGLEPTELFLSPQTFSFLLETLLHAEKQFGISRNDKIRGLTNGNKLEFKKTLCL